MPEKAQLDPSVIAAEMHQKAVDDRAEQARLAAEARAAELRQAEEAKLVEFFVPGDEQSHADFQDYLKKRPVNQAEANKLEERWERRSLRSADFNSYKTENREHNKKALDAIVNADKHKLEALDQMSIGKLAKELAKLRHDNNEVEFDVADTVMSRKLNEMANKANMPEEAIDKLYERVRKLVKKEEAKIADPVKASDPEDSKQPSAEEGDKSGSRKDVSFEDRLEANESNPDPKQPEVVIEDLDSDQKPSGPDEDDIVDAELVGDEASAPEQAQPTYQQYVDEFSNNINSLLDGGKINPTDLLTLNQDISDIMMEASDSGLSGQELLALANELNELMDQVHANTWEDKGDDQPPSPNKGTLFDQDKVEPISGRKEFSDPLMNHQPGEMRSDYLSAKRRLVHFRDSPEGRHPLWPNKNVGDRKALAADVARNLLVRMSREESWTEEEFDKEWELLENFVADKKKPTEPKDKTPQQSQAEAVVDDDKDEEVLEPAEPRQFIPQDEEVEAMLREAVENDELFHWYGNDGSVAARGNEEALELAFTDEALADENEYPEGRPSKLLQVLAERRAKVMASVRKVRQAAAKNGGAALDKISTDRKVQAEAVAGVFAVSLFLGLK